MGPKKKKVASSKNANTTQTSPKGVLSFNELNHDRCIMLDFKLLNWKFMNFKMKFRDNTNIFTLKRILREKHGRMDDLKICFNAYSEANEITNEMLTLAQCGLAGVIPETCINNKGDLVIDEKSIPVIQVFYDFKPTGHDDPVMLFFKKL